MRYNWYEFDPTAILKWHYNSELIATPSSVHSGGAKVAVHSDGVAGGGGTFSERSNLERDTVRRVRGLTAPRYPSII